MKKSHVLIITLITCQYFVAVAQEVRSHLVYLKNATVSLPAQLQLSSDDVIKSTFEGNLYVLMQFNEIPTTEKVLALQKAGVVLGDYLPHYTYIAQLTTDYSPSTLKAAGVKSISSIDPIWKVDSRIAPYWNGAINDGTIRLTVLYHKQANPISIAQSVIAEGGLVIEQLPLFNQFTLELPVQKVKTITEKAWVNWVEPTAPAPAEMNLPGKTLIRTNVLNTGLHKGRNLQGQGVIMGIWDGGSVGTHVDFTGRQTNAQTSSVSTHATHVTGTIGGAGIKDPSTEGMAPKATLLNWDFGGSVSSEVSGAISTNKINITNNSWGYSPQIDSCSFRGRYDNQSRSFDIISNNSPLVTQVWAAGNYQTDNCASGGFRTVLSGYQAAKNIIVIGAVDRNDAMSSFSSFGPARDNRLKPDVCAVGVAVNSTYPSNTYSSIQGTSMATPASSGTVALLYERYRQLNNNDNPDASLIRNMVANTAEDLGNSGPDFKHGYGRINALRAVRLMEENRYFSAVLTPSATNSHNISIPAGCKKVKVMVTWNDPAANAMADISLVNDLDIVLENKAAQQTLPWRLSALSLNTTAQRGRDSLNNIEQVTIDNPDTAGYTLKVNGLVTVPAGQRYYITYEYEYSSLEISYPNGGETFLPGASEQIRWDSKFVTSNVQLHYSIDGGNSWVVITNSQNGSSRYFSWTVPSTITSKALIRVRTTDSSIVDISDTTFAILGTPSLTAPRICSGQLHLTWGTVSGAIAYEAAILTNGKLETKAITSTTNRFHTFTGLNNGTEYWVTVRAIGPDSSRGKFANALNATPTSASAPPSFTKNLPLVTSACINKATVIRIQSAGAATLTRQWQRSTNGGTSWSTTGGNVDTLSLGTVTGSMENYLYRVNLTSSTCGNTVTTTITSLKTDTGLILTHDPMDATACHGSTIKFTYGVVSKNNPNTIWQVSKNNGVSWVNVATLQDTTVTLSAIDTLNNQIIRAIASNGCVTGDTTASALITVKPRLSLTVTNDTNLCIGKSISITAQVTGGASAPIINWNGLGNNNSYMVSPATTTTYTVTANDSCSTPVTDSVKVTVIVVDSTFTHNGSSGKNQVDFTASEAFANSYTWNFGDGSANVNFRSAGHFFVANGNYNVCLTVVKNGCSYTTCQNVNVTRTDVELVNDLADAIKVYPNPATNNIFIAAPVPVQQISLVNELGSRLWESNAPAQSVSISLSPFAAGVYFINVQTDAGIIRKKLIIIK